MATILREWSYRYQWLYDAIARVAALSVGGEARFRQLALEGLHIDSDTQVLDLCCGSGQTTQFLVRRSSRVTGLDASPLSLKRAKQNVPEAKYVEGWAENMPFLDQQFDLVHTSVALHEMEPEQLRQILSEVYRVLKPRGVFALVDFHAPTNPLFVPGLSLFLLLFETETAWQFIATDLVKLLAEVGFEVSDARDVKLPTQQRSTISSTEDLPQLDSVLYAGGSIQVIRSWKGSSDLSS